MQPSPKNWPGSKIPTTALALLRQDRELDPALLNVKNRIGDLTLREHLLVLVKFEDRFPRAHLGEKYFGIKQVLNCVAHVALHYSYKESDAISSEFRMRFDAVAGRRSN